MDNLRDQVIPILFLLQTTKRHLSARDVLLWVLKVFKQCFLIPNNPFLLVCIGVLKSRDLPRLTTEEAEEIGSNFVATTFFECVTLQATSFEEVCALFIISCNGYMLAKIRFIQKVQQRYHRVLDLPA